MLRMYMYENIKYGAERYTHHMNIETHDALVCIQSGKLLSDPKKLYKPGAFYITSEEELLEKFGHIPDALTNTLEIASKRNLRTVIFWGPHPEASLLR